MDEITVAALQMMLTHKEVKANISHLRSLLQANEGGFDVLLLPEMWTTGFVVDVDRMSPQFFADAYEEGRQEMKAVAREYQCAVYGSLIQLLPSGRPANTGLFITPEGGEVEYHKRHLFSHGGEAKLFDAGMERVQVEYRDWQIRLAICYDLRFPTWLRQDPELGYYDLLLCTANWPRPRHVAWERLLRARAIENQCYLGACNRVGTPHPKLRYPGYSFVIDDEGNSLAESKLPDEVLLRATISRQRLQEKRQSFPLLPDQDLFRVINERQP